MHETQNLLFAPPPSKLLGEATQANLCTANSKHLASWILGIKIRLYLSGSHNVQLPCLYYISQPSNKTKAEKTRLQKIYILFYVRFNC